MQVTYLNSIYDPARMAEWKACRLPSGKSLYEEIGAASVTGSACFVQSGKREAFG